jgi:pimeloyl-ACP methyl ester carboxylesterase
MNDITIDNAGVALAASVYGRPELPPVLLMHGISNSRDVWYDWAVELSDRYRVYALDFRGHGHSARAERYGIADYVSDATAILTAIGAPTRIVGHSLGGVVAGALAQRDDALVHSVLMLDPAWYFGIPEEFHRTVYPRRFALLIGLITQLRAAQAPLDDWYAAIANTPHPSGGVFADHMGHRQILSHASALQRQDPACWGLPVQEMFASIDTTQPFRRPTRLIRCDASLGAAFVDEHADVILAVNPTLEITHYVGSDHFPQRTYAFAERFRRDLTSFLRDA